MWISALLPSGQFETVCFCYNLSRGLKMNPLKFQKEVQSVLPIGFLHNIWCIMTCLQKDPRIQFVLTTEQSSQFY